MSKKCKDCIFFQESNKFCRRFPPQPVVINVEDKNTGDQKDIVVSKYPVIVHPEFDYCGEFEDKKLIID